MLSGRKKKARQRVHSVLFHSQKILENANKYTRTKSTSVAAQRGGKGIEENERVEQGINFLEDGNTCTSGCGDGLQ